MGLILLATIALCILALTSSCATVRLERRLDNDTRVWFRVHEILMQTDVPRFITDGQKVSEASYFLQLPKDLQTRYREMFWQIREKQAREYFEGRLEYLRKHQGELGKNSAEYRLILLCGLPDHIQLYGPNWEYLGPASVREDKAYDQTIAMWTYYWESNQCNYAFRSSGGHWVPEALSATEVNNCFRFEQWCRVFFAPTWNGWDEWKKIIGPEDQY